MAQDLLFPTLPLNQLANGLSIGYTPTGLNISFNIYDYYNYATPEEVHQLVVGSFDRPVEATAIAPTQGFTYGFAIKELT